jgi:hypothetical protein
MERKILIGFTTRTSAIWPKFFCPLFRHCAVVVDGALIQIGVDCVRVFKVDRRAIKRLEAAGWVFVELRIKNEELRMGVCSGFGLQLLTCVGFAKRAIGIRAPFVFTPDQLYRHIVKNHFRQNA